MLLHVMFHMCLLFYLQEEIIFNEKQVYTLVSNCEWVIVVQRQVRSFSAIPW